MPDLPAIVRAAAQFRALIAAGDAQALKPILDAYSALYTQTERELKAVLAEIQKDVANGATPGVQRLYERNRLARILAQVGPALQQIAVQASAIATDRQLALIQQAGHDAKKFAEVALGPKPSGFTGISWAHVPAGELEHLAGIAGDGSPLKALLSELVPDGAQRVRDEIVLGVALGRDERVIASNIKTVLGGNMGRALSVVRTEGMRAYRESQRQAYLANADVIAKVRWLASLSSETCPACLANHGRLFDADYVIEAHPNCRCVLVPVTKSFEELGFGPGRDKPDNFQTGEQWFEALPDEKKQKVLGPRAFEAYQRGEVTLSDFRGHRHNDEWGGMYFTNSLDKARQQNQANQSSQPSKTTLPTKKPGKAKGPKAPVTPITPALLTPEASPAPAFDKVSDSFNVQLTGESKKQFERALSHIDSVHGVQDLPYLPVRKTKHNQSFLGAYRHYHDGKPADMLIKEDGPDVELTALHEIGHFLDHQVFAKPGTFGSLKNSALKEWREAINESDAFKELEKLQGQAYTEVTTSSGLTLQVQVSQKHVKYLRKQQELFARSYAQYIATRSGDATLLSQLDKIRNNSISPYRVQHWSDKDFEPIAKAFDNLFEKKGWLKAKP